MTTIATMNKFSDAISLANELRIATNSTQFSTKLENESASVIFQGSLEELDAVTIWLDDSTKKRICDAIFA